MLALLGSVFLAASALAAGNDGPIPPHLRGCANITIQSEGNCPRKNYECDESLPIKYDVHHGHWGSAEVRCVDRKARLAVDHKIVDSVRCRDKKWRAESGCNIPTTSVVCAKYCGIEACPASFPNAPSKYVDLTVYNGNFRRKCAVAKCQYGFVALSHRGHIIKEFPPFTNFTCSGNGQWAASKTETYAHLMCKRRPEPPCPFKCNEKPWTFSYMNATSAAISNGCSYFCPAGQALTVKNEMFAVVTATARCTRRGFQTSCDKFHHQIGCTTCDVLDGEVATLPNQKPAISSNCVLTCPRGFALRYGMGSFIKFAPDNVMFREFRPAGANNTWIAKDGFDLTKSFWTDCWSTDA